MDEDPGRRAGNACPGPLLHADRRAAPIGNLCTGETSGPVFYPGETFKVGRVAGRDHSKITKRLFPSPETQDSPESGRSRWPATPGPVIQLAGPYRLIPGRSGACEAHRGHAYAITGRPGLVHLAANPASLRLARGVAPGGNCAHRLRSAQAGRCGRRPRPPWRSRGRAAQLDVAGDGWPPVSGGPDERTKRRVCCPARGLAARPSSRPVGRRRVHRGRARVRAHLRMGAGARVRVSALVVEHYQRCDGRVAGEASRQAQELHLAGSGRDE